MSTVLLDESSTPADPRPDRDALYEVVDGVTVELPEMSAPSNQIKSRLQTRLGAFAETHESGQALSETLFILDAERNLRRRPDVAFLSPQRWPLDREVPWEGDWPVVPDLCIEVTSPHDLYDDVTGKVREYFAYGVGQVWVVWPPEREVHIYHSRDRQTILGEGGEVGGGDILPGFSLPVADLFGHSPA